MIRFGNPETAPVITPEEKPEKRARVKREVEFDPAEHLNDKEDLDEWADKLWEKQDWTNYNLVANYINKMVGWKRQTIVSEGWKPKIGASIAPPVVSEPKAKVSLPENADQEAIVKAMWAAGKRICDIGRETGLPGSKIRKFIA